MVKLPSWLPLLLWASAAHAGPDCADLYARFHGAAAAEKPARLRAAIDCYCQAYERAGAAGNPDALFLCASGRHQLGMYELAARHYRTFLALDDPRKDSEEVAQAQAWLPKALRGKPQDWVEPPPPVAPPTAAPATAPPAPPDFPITIQCTPAGAMITLDGLPAGQCPRATLRRSAGSYAVTVSAPDHLPASQQIEVTGPRSVTLTARRPSPRLAPWIVGGAGALLVGTAGVFHARNLTHADDLETVRSTGRDDPDLADTVLLDRNLALGGYLIGGALLTAGITWLIWGDDEEAP